MNKEQMQKAFDKLMVEKINWVCGGGCFSSNIQHNINPKLAAGKKLGLYSGEILDEKTIEALEALHTLEFFDEIRTIILKKTGLGHLFEKTK